MAGSPGGVLDLDVLSDLPGGDDPANIPFPPLVADWAPSTPLTTAERAAVAAAIAAGRVQRVEVCRPKAFDPSRVAASVGP
jgi:hypothetical protein